MMMMMMMMMVVTRKGKKTEPSLRVWAESSRNDHVCAAYKTCNQLTTVCQLRYIGCYTEITRDCVLGQLDGVSRL